MNDFSTFFHTLCKMSFIETTKVKSLKDPFFNWKIVFASFLEEWIGVSVIISLVTGFDTYLLIVRLINLL
jgi:hypothetical protein